MHHQHVAAQMVQNLDRRVTQNTPLKSRPGQRAHDDKARAVGTCKRRQQFVRAARKLMNRAGAYPAFLGQLIKGFAMLFSNVLVEFFDHEFFWLDSPGYPRADLLKSLVGME